MHLQNCYESHLSFSWLYGNLLVDKESANDDPASDTKRIRKFSDWVDNEMMMMMMINTHWEEIQSVLAADSQNSDTTAPSGIELYHLQFSLQRPVRKLLDTPST
jgi:hypothetical protein